MIRAASAYGAPPPVVEVDVWLVALGPTGVRISTIRELTGLDQREAMRFLRRLPACLARGVWVEEAKGMKARLEERGAIVELREPEGGR